MNRESPATREAWLAAERGYVRPREGRPRLSVALVYPNSYHIAMSSLGYQIAYRVLNDLPGIVAERFFLDSAHLGSIESGAPLADFDVLAFSASFEMDEPYLLDLIASAGLEVEARGRIEGSHSPLILMGGVLVSVNRLPLYPFVDVFLHGDAEIALPSVFGALAEAESREPRGHRRRLEAIEGLPGVEITPGARLAAGMNLDAELEAASLTTESGVDAELMPRPAAPPAPRLTELEAHVCSTQILSPHCEFSDMALIDLARGCPHHCTFCWIGHNSPPYRARSLETIFRAIEAWMPATKRFGLVSSAVGAHPEIDDLCRWMMARDLQVSYSSLRVEEVTPTMLEALCRGGGRTITIAPEAGNLRVRRLLGKRISDEEILDVVDRALSLGTENIKLYYMIGIPSETDDEALDIARFSERVREVMLRRGRPRGRIGYLGINLGIFVPKPNIPLNHIEPVPLDQVKRRLKRVVRELNRIPNTRLNVSSPDLAVAQSVLSVGGIEASRYIRLVRESGGDWRGANRAWRAELGRHFERHQRLSRLSKERVQARVARPVAS
jgi:radical SAM superfamily enzyme YgiQ (UPF0313 family)